MRICDKQKDIMKFMDENVANYYPNALCFEDKNKLKLMSNWFDFKYENFFFSIDACEGTNAYGYKCKPMDEINEFI